MPLPQKELRPHTAELSGLARGMIQGHGRFPTHWPHHSLYQRTTQSILKVVLPAINDFASKVFLTCEEVSRQTEPTYKGTQNFPGVGERKLQRVWSGMLGGKMIFLAASEEVRVGILPLNQRHQRKQLLLCVDSSETVAF